MCWHVLQAQNEKMIRGIILEKTNNGLFVPIVGAHIRVLNTRIERVSDSSGQFQIPFHAHSQLHIHAIGYQDDTLAMQEHDYMQIWMISKTRLQEVIVGVERKNTEIMRLESMKIQVMGEKELYKAACCNLSESFETNPSVDVSYPDAVTGTRQIQMLGLASQYIQLTQEAMPSMRGIVSGNGWAFTPGSWIQSIQLTKGVGSVVNGFESISGQINTELQKPAGKDTLFANLYINQAQRMELNAAMYFKKHPSFQSAILLHGSQQNYAMDYNHDMFRDMPTGYQLNGLYRWMYNPGNGFVTQGGIRILRDQKVGGHMDFNGVQDSSANHLMYGIKQQSEREEIWMKLAWNFPGKVYKSIGWQNSFFNHKQDNYYGFNTYVGNQQSFYSNLIFQNIIGNTSHKYRTGLSLQSDWIDEKAGLNTSPLYFNTNIHLHRNEHVIGGFYEYTYSYLQKWNVVLGIRYDYNSIFNGFFTPRLHVRYAINENHTLRLATGMGRRTPNPLAENSALFISNRLWLIDDQAIKQQVAFKQEVAWNSSLSYVWDFRWMKRKGQFSAEYHYTQFSQQIVIDRDAFSSKFAIPLVSMYQLNGQSYSHNAQIQCDYEIRKRLELRMAYRRSEVYMDYQSGLREVPMIAKHRAFINLAYTTRSKWAFDWTTSYTGAKRLPQTKQYESLYQLPEYSPGFYISSAQITKSFVKWHTDVYVGAENIFDFKQNNPILNASNPYGKYFDASMTWGPIFGRMIYTGFRWRI